MCDLCFNSWRVAVSNLSDQLDKGSVVNLSESSWNAEKQLINVFVGVPHYKEWNLYLLEKQKENFNREPVCSASYHISFCLAFGPWSIYRKFRTKAIIVPLTRTFFEPFFERLCFWTHLAGNSLAKIQCKNSFIRLFFLFSTFFVRGHMYSSWNHNYMNNGNGTSREEKKTWQEILGCADRIQVHTF